MERGVLPIGDWSIFITLSRLSAPVILSNLPGLFFAPFKVFAKYLYKISFTRLDLPEPETPVTAMNLPSGNSTSIFFRLFSCAPKTVSFLPLPALRFSGTGILRFPLKYIPVIDLSQLIISSTLPAAMSSPPLTPAPGPISTIKSAFRMVSSSCSTTISVFPKSRRFLSVPNSLSLSL